MRIIKRLVIFTLGMIAVVVGLYFVISLCILFFMFTNQLSQGGPMFFEMRTPTYTQLFLFQIICIVIISLCFATRLFLGRERGPLLRTQLKLANFVMISNRAFLLEYLRPWKLFTLAVGIVLLIIGSFYYDAPDWDIPISFIMGGLAYLTAPWSIRVLLGREWHFWPLMIFFTWFSVDGCYAIYWYFKNPIALSLMREVNFPASLSLYWACGLIWLYRGSFRQLLGDAKKILSNSNH